MTRLPSPSSSLSRLLGILAPLVGSTPPVTHQPAVAALWQSVLSLSLTLLPLWVMLAGGLLPVESLLGRPGNLLHALLRLIASVLLLGLTPRFVDGCIALNNLLLRQLALRVQLLAPLAAPGGGSWWETLVLWLPDAVLLLVLSVAYLVRLAEILVLYVLSPLVSLSAMLPVTSFLVGVWAREVVTAVFSQFLQGLLLVLAQALTSGAPEDLPTALVAVAVLYLMIRLPFWLRQGLGAASGELVAAAGRWLVHL